MDYNLLFRWFVVLNPDDDVWDPTVFTKNRDRLREAVVKEFLGTWWRKCGRTIFARLGSPIYSLTGLPH